MSDRASSAPGTGSTGRDRTQVVVTVGTDHHPFDRLVGWIEAWSARRADVTTLLQRGESRSPTGLDPSGGLRSVVMVPYDEMVSAMAGADAVVAQGGPAAIMDARSVGRRPIVVPRRGSLGEHVDDHQVAFAAWMGDRDLVTVAGSEEELAELLDRAVAEPATFHIAPDGGAVADTLRRFAEVVDPLMTAGAPGPLGRHAR